MAQTFPSEVLALLDEGRSVVRGMMRFDFGTGVYGFIRKDTEFTYGGLVYKPGSLIKVSDLSGGIGIAARQFNVTLASSDADTLTPDVLQTIEAEDYRDRRVTIYDAHFHPDTGMFLTVKAMRRGYVDTIEHRESEDGYILVANCETRALDYTRTNGRKRTTADQTRRSPTDLFFEHATKRGREEIFWGREKKT